jgi:hypothetical protein
MRLTGEQSSRCTGKKLANSYFVYLQTLRSPGLRAAIGADPATSMPGGSSSGLVGGSAIFRHFK